VITKAFWPLASEWHSAHCNPVYNSLWNNHLRANSFETQVCAFHLKNKHANWKTEILCNGTRLEDRVKTKKKNILVWPLTDLWLTDYTSMSWKQKPALEMLFANWGTQNGEPTPNYPIDFTGRLFLHGWICLCGLGMLNPCKEDRPSNKLKLSLYQWMSSSSSSFFVLVTAWLLDSYNFVGVRCSYATDALPLYQYTGTHFADFGRMTGRVIHTWC